MNDRPDLSRWTALKEISSRGQLTPGPRLRQQLTEQPGILLQTVSSYKFAARMIGPGKSVLHLGCGEGLGTWILAKECGSALGLDPDKWAIETARSNWPDEQVGFRCRDLSRPTGERFDAVVALGAFESIPAGATTAFIARVCSSLRTDGIAVVGVDGRTRADDRRGRRCTTASGVLPQERLEQEMRGAFAHVFLFNASDESVHVGPRAEALVLALGCRKRRPKKR